MDKQKIQDALDGLNDLNEDYADDVYDYITTQKELIRTCLQSALDGGWQPIETLPQPPNEPKE